MPRWFNTAGPCRPADHYTLPVAPPDPSVRGAHRAAGPTSSSTRLARSARPPPSTPSPTSSPPRATTPPCSSPWRSAPASPTTPAPRSSPSSTLGAVPPFAPACPVTSSRRPGRGLPGRRIGAALQRLVPRLSAPARPLPRRDRRPRRRPPHLCPPPAPRRLPRPPRELPLLARPRRPPRRPRLQGRAPRQRSRALGRRLGTASPFNIKVRSLTLRDFTADEVAELYAQHTADTGQVFTPRPAPAPSSSPRASPGSSTRSPKRPSTSSSLIPRARHRRRHRRRQRGADPPPGHPPRQPRRAPPRAACPPDHRADARRRRPPAVPEDDLRYVLDLGLVRARRGAGIVIANPIYREMIPRALTSDPQRLAPADPTPPGSPPTAASILRACSTPSSPSGASTASRSSARPYHEVAPHLVLMAFLHRVANGGGTLEREYAIGSGRMDLLLTYRGDRLAIELKVWRDRDADPRSPRASSSSIVTSTASASTPAGSSSSTAAPASPGSPSAPPPSRHLPARPPHHRRPRLGSWERSSATTSTRRQAHPMGLYERPARDAIKIPAGLIAPTAPAI
jgi:hypothetical protein